MTRNLRLFFRKVNSSTTHRIDPKFTTLRRTILKHFRGVAIMVFRLVDALFRHRTQRESFFNKREAKRCSYSGRRFSYLPIKISLTTPILNFYLKLKGKRQSKRRFILGQQAVYNYLITISRSLSKSL